MLRSCEGSYFGIPGGLICTSEQEASKVKKEYPGNRWTRLDQAQFSLLSSPLLLFPQAPSPLGLCKNAGETQRGKKGKGKLVISSPGYWGKFCLLSRILDKTLLTFAGWAEVPRPQALVAFCMHSNDFQTRSSLGSQVIREADKFVFTAQFRPTLRDKGH